MKKILFMLMLVPLVIFGQDINWGMWSHPFDSTSCTLTNSDTAWIWVSLPNEFDYANNTSWPPVIPATTSTKPTTLKIPYSGENYWNGNFYIGLYPTFASGALDSLKISWSPYDNLGNVFTNDVRYVDLSNGTSSETLVWNLGLTTGTAYGASSNGQAVNTCGIRFTIIQHASSCTNAMVFKVWKN